MRVTGGPRCMFILEDLGIWASFFQCTLETRWLGVRNTCGIGLFYRKYRPLLRETGWLGSDFISVCLETRWLGQNIGQKRLPVKGVGAELPWPAGRGA